MAWAKQTGTRHSASCNMTFGRKDASCPRCQELIAGSAPRSWGSDVRQASDTEWLNSYCRCGKSELWMAKCDTCGKSVYTD